MLYVLQRKYFETKLKPGTTNCTIKELNKSMAEQLFVFAYLEKSDQYKYGSILKSLNEQKSLGNDQYPKIISETNNVLSNHRFDNMKSNNNRKDSKKEKEEIPATGGEESPTLSFAQLEGKYYYYGNGGHKSPQCNKKNLTPCEEWARNNT